MLENRKVKLGVTELRWAYVVFGLLAFIDVLIGMRAVQRLVRHEGQISPDAPFFLLSILLLELLLVWLYFRLKHTFRSYEHLKGALEQELDFTHQLLDSVTEGMLVFSPEGNIIYANRAASEILGHSNDSLLGRGSLDLILPEDKELIQKQVEMDWSKPNQIYHLRVHDAQGQVRKIRLTSNPRWHHGRIVGAFTAIRPEED